MGQGPGRRRPPPDAPSGMPNRAPAPSYDFRTFPWELALGAFAAASILLSALLAIAGSGAPSLVLAIVGVMLATGAGVAGWRRLGGARTLNAARPLGPARRPGEGLGERASRTGRRGAATRTGDDGADLDITTIPEFRQRRGPSVSAVPGGSSAADDVRVVPVPEGAGAAARDFAEAGSAIASAILVRRGRRLLPLAVAGNWGAARDARPGEGEAGLAYDSDVAVGAPEFPIDDVLSGALASSPRAMPLERWEDLADVPAGMLPLVALADQGVAVAVASAHRGRLLVTWVASARQDGRRYTERDLAAFEAVARDRSPILVPALQDG